MKHAALVMALAFLALPLAARPQTQGAAKAGGAEQELLKLEREWNDAVVRRDIAFLDRILADDYLSTDNDGVVSTKAQLIASLTSGELSLSSAVADDVKVRVYGDAAVVTFRNIEKGPPGAGESRGPYRVTDTWIKRGGRWQCVSEHYSKITRN